MTCAPRLQLQRKQVGSGMEYKQKQEMAIEIVKYIFSGVMYK